MTQSNPGFVTGQVPSANDWNNAFAGKLDANAVSNSVSNATTVPAISVFSANGTYTKLSTSTIIDVEVWGSGGGAAMGNVAATSTAIGPGGGGGGGAKRRVRFRAVDIANSVAITVAQGGLGGNTTANATAGGPTSFGTYAMAPGGGPGTLIALTGTAFGFGGSGGGLNTALGAGAFGATSGGNTITGSNMANAAAAGDGGGGGAVGGGISNANIANVGGSATWYSISGTFTQSGGALGMPGAAPPAWTYGSTNSVGGTGGGSSVAGNGGNGGAGQTPAGGGGSGGCCQTGFAPGLGAPGGNGLCIVWEW